MARYNIEIRIRSTGAKAAEAEIKGLGGTVKNAAAGINTLTAAMRALPFALLAREVARATMEFDRINSSLRVATGSAQAGAREFKFISEEAQRLGLSLTSAAGEYSKLAAAARGTALAGEPARKIFTATAEAATALGLSAEESAGALRAFQQMISKGTVAAEELRGQLGERIPGAFQMAARAMGLTTMELGKMLEAGQVTAEDLLPKLAEEMHKTFGPEAERNAHSLNAELNRMQTNLKLLADKAGGEMAQSVGLLNKALKTVLDNFGNIRGGFALLQQAGVEVLRALVAASGALALAIANIGEGWGKVYAFMTRNENPLAGFVESTKQVIADVDQFLENLSQGFKEVAVEQFAEDMAQTAPVVKSVADEIERGAAATSAMADAAARARSEFAGIRPGQLVGAVPLPQGPQLAPLNERTLDALEEMGQKMRDEAEMWGKAMQGQTKGIGIQWKEMAKQVGAALIGTFAAIATGSIKDSKAIGATVLSTVGSVVGTIFGGPVGAAIGGAAGAFLGSAIGGLFKGSRPFGGINFGAVGGDFAMTGANVNKHGDLAQMQQIGKQLTDQINGILQGLGATLEGLSKDIGFIVRDGNAIVNVNGIQRDFGKNMQQAVEFFILEVIRSAELSGLSDSVLGAIKAAATQAGGDMSAFQRDLAFIQEIERFGKSDSALALEALERHFNELRDAAVRLGLDLDKVNAEYERQRGEILALAAAEQERIDAEARRAEEEAAAARRAAHEAAVEARRAFREELELLELAAGGASSGMVDLVRNLQHLDRWLEEQRAAGVRGTGRFRELTLQGWLDNALAPVRDILGPTTEADRIRQQFADIRAQVEFIAEQMGIAVEPFLAMIAAAEASELERITREAADAERELTRERERQVQALEDLTRPDFIKRLRDLFAQIAAATGGGTETNLPGGMVALGLPDPAAIAAGEAALQLLGRDFLQSLQQMGIVIPGLNEALAEYNRIQALASANALLMAGAIDRAQWEAATAGINAFFDGVTDGTQQAADAAQQYADALRDAADAQREQFESFQSLWNQLIVGGEDDPIKRIKAQFDELASMFAFGLTLAQQKAFLGSQGVDTSGIIGTLGPNGTLAAFETLIGPAEAEAIAKAIADALQPIRDFFEDMRVQGAGLTQTQRFQNALSDFNAALAGDDITRAVELARMLTGDLGVGQFGSSSEAFSNLRDFIINALGGKLPEGAPADLLGQRTAAAAERTAGGIDRMLIFAEQQNTILRDGFRDLRRDLRDGLREGGYVH